MLEAVELVVTALSAGAAVGAKDTASLAVKDAYTGLKALSSKALRRAKTESLDEDAALKAPEDHRGELLAALIDAEAGNDAELLEAARTLLGLLDAGGPVSGRYVVDVHDNKGVQIGDGNTMSITFTD